MRVLIMSDTHRSLDNAYKAIEESGKIDMCLHLGDVEGDGEMIKRRLDCPLYMVRGNNDYCGIYPEELELYIGKYRVFMTHGHRYLVGMGIERLRDEALSCKADIAIYGHTHKPYINRGNDITIICPGSISYPRQHDRKPTYILMEVLDDGPLSIDCRKL